MSSSLPLYTFFPRPPLTSSYSTTVYPDSSSLTAQQVVDLLANEISKPYIKQKIGKNLEKNEVEIAHLIAISTKGNDTKIGVCKKYFDVLRDIDAKRPALVLLKLLDSHPKDFWEICQLLESHSIEADLNELPNLYQDKKKWAEAMSGAFQIFPQTSCAEPIIKMIFRGLNNVFLEILFETINDKFDEKGKKELLSLWITSNDNIPRRLAFSFEGGFDAKKSTLAYWILLFFLKYGPDAQPSRGSFSPSYRPKNSSSGFSFSNSTSPSGSSSSASSSSSSSISFSLSTSLSPSSSRDKKLFSDFSLISISDLYDFLSYFEENVPSDFSAREKARLLDNIDCKALVKEIDEVENLIDWLIWLCSLTNDENKKSAVCTSFFNYFHKDKETRVENIKEFLEGLIEKESTLVTYFWPLFLEDLLSISDAKMVTEILILSSTVSSSGEYESERVIRRLDPLKIECISSTLGFKIKLDNNNKEIDDDEAEEESDDNASTTFTAAEIIEQAYLQFNNNTEVSSEVLAYLNKMPPFICAVSFQKNDLQEKMLKIIHYFNEEQLGLIGRCIPEQLKKKRNFEKLMTNIHEHRAELLIGKSEFKKLKAVQFKAVEKAKKEALKSISSGKMEKNDEISDKYLSLFTVGNIAYLFPDSKEPPFTLDFLAKYGICCDQDFECLGIAPFNSDLFDKLNDCFVSSANSVHLDDQKSREKLRDIRFMMCANHGPVKDNEIDKLIEILNLNEMPAQELAGIIDTLSQSLNGSSNFSRSGSRYSSSSSSSSMLLDEKSLCKQKIRAAFSLLQGGLFRLKAYLSQGNDSWRLFSSSGYNYRSLSELYKSQPNVDPYKLSMSIW